MYAWDFGYEQGSRYFGRDLPIYAIYLRTIADCQKLSRKLRLELMAGIAAYRIDNPEA